MNSVCQSGSPNRSNEERSSWSEAVTRRGSWSCVRFFIAQKAPPVTIVASTRFNLRQRSSPPWASTIRASSLFMVSLSSKKRVKKVCRHDAPTSVHSQNHAKARLSSHHLRVGSRRLVEWDGLDHGRHAA